MSLAPSRATIRLGPFHSNNPTAKRMGLFKLRMRGFSRQPSRGKSPSENSTVGARLASMMQLRRACPWDSPARLPNGTSPVKGAWL
jgi:hypothetical protein